MADLATELQYLGEADVRVASIGVQIENLIYLILNTPDERVLSSYQRSMQLLLKTQQAFKDHRAYVLATVERLQREKH